MRDAEGGPAAVEAIYRAESRRVLATLIRLLGDFEPRRGSPARGLRAAVQQWPRDGVPANPRAWLVSAGRFKAIDALRRRSRDDQALRLLAVQLEESADVDDPDALEDDRLRLIFTCCHPALPADARVALTLRTVCDLSTEEIARAFLVPPATIAQRIVRAKAKIRDAQIAYQVPERTVLAERLDSVLQVLYLVFNEGYAASTGAQLTRADLCREAIRLGRLLLELLPEAEVCGLLALMLLHDARRAARTDATGELVRLDEQDRRLWDAAQIAEGVQLVQRALTSRYPGCYGLQAAIAAVHAEAPSAAQTDWAQIVRLYDLLLQLSPSPVIELNRAVALAMHRGPAAGLALLDELHARGALPDYHLLHAARADLLCRLGRYAEARQAYRMALQGVRLEPERRFLLQRLAALENAGGD
ncbi:ECF subfamily RNA polymerase sigma-70 factor [Stutzerimonas degradans]|nr:ECF subfamily RNA polymerase sigma-70 factor [Stutzerimonas degradans]